MGVPVSHTMEDGLPVVPQERVLHRTQEQIVDVLVPQIVEERVHDCTQEQLADSLVPPIMEAVLPSTPQERVQNLTQALMQSCSFVRQIMEEIGDGVQQVPSKRMPERHGDCNIKGLDKYNMPCAGVVPDIVPTGFVRVADVFRPLPQGPKRVFVDSAPPHTASKPYTGKVFTVEMPHQHVHQAYPGDSVVFNIKGLDKHNMPRSGDVMVPALQIQGHLVPRQGSTALSGADIACVLGVLKRTLLGSLSPS